MSAPVGREATGGRTILGVCLARNSRMEGCDGGGVLAAPKGAAHLPQRMELHAVISHVLTGELRLKVFWQEVHLSVALPACVCLRRNFVQVQSTVLVEYRSRCEGEAAGEVQEEGEGG